MTDIENEDEREPTLEEIFEEASLNIKESISAFLQLIGEMNGDRVVTNWVVVAATSGLDDNGELEDGDPIVLTRRSQPSWLTKGLLRDALDQDAVHDTVRMLINVQTQLGEDDD